MPTALHTAATPASGTPSTQSLFLSPLIFWHLLSLDAPTVAVLWTLAAARLAHVTLPLASLAAMALAVWTLYAADRLLDTRDHALRTALQLEPRHLFHHRHRTAFLVGIAAATAALAILLPRLSHAAIDLYLAEAALLAGYFLLIHAAPAAQPRAIPKELLVGPFFAAATFIPSVARHPALRPVLLPSAILFTALCTLNCLFIYAWEHPGCPPANPLTRSAIRHLPLLTLLFLLSAILLAILTPNPRYSLSCALSGLLLQSLHLVRHRISRLTLRAAADAALLTPIFLVLTLPAA